MLKYIYDELVEAATIHDKEGGEMLKENSSIDISKNKSFVTAFTICNNLKYLGVNEIERRITKGLINNVSSEKLYDVFALSNYSSKRNVKNVAQSIADTINSVYSLELKIDSKSFDEKGIIKLKSEKELDKDIFTKFVDITNESIAETNGKADIPYEVEFDYKNREIIIREQRKNVAGYLLSELEGKKTTQEKLDNIVGGKKLLL